MRVIIEAVYEQGALRLMEPISLAEGTRVEVMVMTGEPAPKDKMPAEILAAIAALPLEAGGEEFSARDHDKILY